MQMQREGCAGIFFGRDLFVQDDSWLEVCISLSSSHSCKWEVGTVLACLFQNIQGFMPNVPYNIHACPAPSRVVQDLWFSWNYSWLNHKKSVYKSGTIIEVAEGFNTVN